jgi:indolepyruvate ferredoxin oxidoreductase alpha subunit
MQVNAGTGDAFQAEGRRVNIEAVIRGIGPDRVEVVDPFDLSGMTAALKSCLVEPRGVNVVLAQRECAIPAKRRGIVAGHTTVDPDKCILCKRCLKMTGCPALGIRQVEPLELSNKSPEGDFSGSQVTASAIAIDTSLCNGCGLCVHFCPTNALQWDAGNSQAPPCEVLERRATSKGASCSEKPSNGGFSCVDGESGGGTA